MGLRERLPDWDREDGIVNAVATESEKVKLKSYINLMRRYVNQPIKIWATYKSEEVEHAEILFKGENRETYVDIPVEQGYPIMPTITIKDTTCCTSENAVTGPIKLWLQSKGEEEYFEIDTNLKEGGTLQISPTNILNDGIDANYTLKEAQTEKDGRIYFGKESQNEYLKQYITPTSNVDILEIWVGEKDTLSGADMVFEIREVTEDGEILLEQHDVADTVFKQYNSEDFKLKFPLENQWEEGKTYVLFFKISHIYTDDNSFSLCGSMSAVKNNLYSQLIDGTWILLDADIYYKTYIKSTTGTYPVIEVPGDRLYIEGGFLEEDDFEFLISDCICINHDEGETYEIVDQNSLDTPHSINVKYEYDKVVVKDINAKLQALDIYPLKKMGLYFEDGTLIKEKSFIKEKHYVCYQMKVLGEDLDYTDLPFKFYVEGEWHYFDTIRKKGFPCSPDEELNMYKPNLALDAHCKTYGLFRREYRDDIEYYEYKNTYPLGYPWVTEQDYWLEKRLLGEYAARGKDKVESRNTSDIEDAVDEGDTLDYGETYDYDEISEFNVISDDNVFLNSVYILDNGTVIGSVNDDDTDNVFEVTTEPTNGTVVLETDGSFVYTPDEYYAGQDEFTYSETDGESNVTEDTISFYANANGTKLCKLTCIKPHVQDLIISVYQESTEIDGEIITEDMVQIANYNKDSEIIDLRHEEAVSNGDFEDGLLNWTYMNATYVDEDDLYVKIGYVGDSGNPDVDEKYISQIIDFTHSHSLNINMRVQTNTFTQETNEDPRQNKILVWVDKDLVFEGEGAYEDGEFVPFLQENWDTIKIDTKDYSGLHKLKIVVSAPKLDKADDTDGECWLDIKEVYINILGDIEVYEFNSVHQFVKDVNENSDLVMAEYLNNPDSPLLYEVKYLLAEGNYKRFGLIPAEIFSYLGKFPEIKNMWEYATIYNRRYYNNNLWAGDLIMPGVFRVDINYPLYSNFKLITNTDINTILKKCKKLGTEGFSAYKINAGKVTMGGTVDTGSVTPGYVVNCSIKTGITVSRELSLINPEAYTEEELAAGPKTIAERKFRVGNILSPPLITPSSTEPRTRCGVSINTTIAQYERIRLNLDDAFANKQTITRYIGSSPTAIVAPGYLTGTFQTNTFRATDPSPGYISNWKSIEFESSYETEGCSTIYELIKETATISNIVQREFVPFGTESKNKFLQIITPGSDEISSITLKGRVVGDEPTDKVKVSLYELESQTPVTVIASNTVDWYFGEIDVETENREAGEIEINIIGTPLIKDNQYGIVVERDGETDNENYFEISIDNNSSFPGKSFFYKDGWVPINNSNCWFIIKKPNVILRDAESPQDLSNIGYVDFKVRGYLTVGNEGVSPKFNNLIVHKETVNES